MPRARRGFPRVKPGTGSDWRRRRGPRYGPGRRLSCEQVRHIAFLNKMFQVAFSRLLQYQCFRPRHHMGCGLMLIDNKNLMIEQHAGESRRVAESRSPVDSSSPSRRLRDTAGFAAARAEARGERRRRSAARSAPFEDRRFGTRLFFRHQPDDASQTQWRRRGSAMPPRAAPARHRRGGYRPRLAHDARAKASPSSTGSSFSRRVLAGAAPAGLRQK